MNPVFCSTGTFVGRINNRDHSLLLRYGEKIEADGFELLIMSVWYDRLSEILNDIYASGFKIPVVHCDKSIGDLLSFGDEKTVYSAVELMKLNCESAAFLGAERVVVHPWGIPHSDLHFEHIAENLEKLISVAKSYNLDAVFENCCTKNRSPFENLKILCSFYPTLGVIIDTRPAQFHRELEKICADSDFIKNHVRHIHINDYHGGYMDWDALHPILHPGKGDINFEHFFSALLTAGYEGSFTLEAPSMRPDTVDFDEINGNLMFIREKIRNIKAE